MAEHPRDRRRVEEVCVVSDVGRHPLPGRLHRQRQIKLRRGRRKSHLRQREVFERHGVAGRVLEDEHHLKERRLIDAACGLQLVNQFLERQTLVGERRQGDLADPLE